MKRTALKRKPAKRRPPGVGCQRKGRKSCRKDAVVTIDGTRLCATHAADQEVAKVVRAQARCFGSGMLQVTCGGGWQACHVIGRSRRALRWDITTPNIVCMCAGHHVWFTHHPEDWREYVIRRGIDFDALHLRAETDPPMDPLRVIEELRP